MIGIDNMMFSVDSPFKNSVEATDFLNKLLLTNNEKQLFAGKNASGLLKINSNFICKKGNIGSFKVSRIRLKSRIGKYLISKLIIYSQCCITLIIDKIPIIKKMKISETRANISFSLSFCFVI